MVKSLNTIYGIRGYKGDGKTTLDSLLCLDEYENNNLKIIYANYRLKIPTFKWLNPYNMLINIALFENSFVAIDELQDYADSRDSNSFQNKYISSWFLKSRHTSTDVGYTTQFFDQIDKRIERITDIFIAIKNLEIDSDNDGDDDTFEFIIYDRRKNFLSDVKTFYAKPIFDIFDSKERINPFILSKEKKNKLISIIEEMNEEKYNENKYSEDILSKTELKEHIIVNEKINIVNKF